MIITISPWTGYRRYYTINHQIYQIFPHWTGLEAYVIIIIYLVLNSNSHITNFFVIYVFVLVSIYNIYGYTDLMS